MMCRWLLMTTAVLLISLPVLGAEQTYRDVLTEKGVAAVVRCELGGLAENVKRNVTIAPDMVAWSTAKILDLSPHVATSNAAAKELHAGYGKFLIKLAGLSEEATKTVQISPEIAERFLASAPGCGLIPCAAGCCAPYCDPCKK